MSDDERPSLAELAAEANRRKGRGRQENGVDHDARCDNQDAELRAIKMKADALAEELHQDELRVQRLMADLENLMRRVPESLGADIAILSAKVSTAIRDLDDLKALLRQEFVTRAELDPIRRIVYGITGLILTGVIGGLLGLVILRGGQ